jgi:hypothetical protein
LNYDLLKLACGAVATIGLYSVLYRENKFYRFFEHMFIGLAVGFGLVALWKETLYDSWWTKMLGQVAEHGHKGQPGYWLWVMLLPIGLLGYTVFSKKHNWMSRIPVGIIIGLWAGQQIQVWFTQYGPQLLDSMRPILPNTHEFFHPDPATVSATQKPIVDNTVYVSTAIDNIIFLVTLLSVLSYFLFSFDVKNKFLKGTSTLGRWLLMIGFGAIFGSTVMMRFALLIDRMYFIFIEFLKHGVFQLK